MGTRNMGIESTNTLADVFFTDIAQKDTSLFQVWPIQLGKSVTMGIFKVLTKNITGNSTRFISMPVMGAS